MTGGPTRGVAPPATNLPPTAFELGYSDGYRERYVWRKILKPEFFDEYDKGFFKGQQARWARRTQP